MATQHTESPPLTEPEIASQAEPSSRDSTAQNATQPSSSSNPTTSSETSTSSNITSTEPPQSPKRCQNCKTTKNEKELKPCNKCHTALYCSRDCQKAAWKTHKKTCPEDAQKYALANPVKLASAPRVPKEGHRGGLQKWQFDT